jgi:hypothetical protein
MMKRIGLVLFCLFILFAYESSAQYTKEDSLRIFKNIEIADSLFEMKLYIDAQDYYWFAIAHITNKINHSTFYSTTLRMERLKLEVQEKIKNIESLLLNYDQDSIIYFRYLGIAEEYILNHREAEAVTALKVAIEHNQNDSMASALLVGLLKYDEDTLDIPKYLPNYFIVNARFEPISQNTPNTDVVYNAFDTSLFNGVIHTAIFDTQTNSITQSFHSYQSGYIVQTRRYSCPTNIDLKKLTYVMIDSLLARPIDSACSINSHVAYIVNDTSHTDAYIIKEDNMYICAYNRFKNSEMEEAITFDCGNLDLENIPTGSNVDFMLNHFSNFCTMITHTVVRRTGNSVKTKTTYGSDSVIVISNYYNSYSNIRNELLKSDIDGDTLYYESSTSKNRIQIYFDQPGILLGIVQQDVDSSGAEHYREYNSDRELIFWSTNEGNRTVVRSLFELESYSVWITVHSRIYPYDFEGDSLVFLFSNSLISEEKFVRKLNDYKSEYYSVFFLKLSEYDSDYIPIIYSSYSGFDPDSQKDVAQLHQKLVKHLKKKEKRN